MTIPEIPDGPSPTDAWPISWNPEQIPEAAIKAAATALAEGGWSASLFEDYARLAVTAALPHLRVQETPGAKLAVIDALKRADGFRVGIGHAVHGYDAGCPVCQGSPSGIAEVLSAAGILGSPAPRPVVDREAMRSRLWDSLAGSGLRGIFRDELAEAQADAILSLLSTEEASGGEEDPQRTDPASTQDPEQTPHPSDGHVRQPTRSADAEELAQTSHVTRGLTEEDTKGAGS